MISQASSLLSNYCLLLLSIIQPQLHFQDYRIIATRINSHLVSFPSLSPYQSAYRKFYSTETALLRITNDILLSCDRQKVTALVLLDLSAAFDTIDHTILLSRLSTT